jgi:hypothetical protein
MLVTAMTPILKMTTSQTGLAGTQRIASEIFFFQNYFPGLWNHTWSLEDGHRMSGNAVG